ncbi:uncharacterized protein LOC125040267 [Penaeus chinensis]|uniref:uncharacterized protein LOC125040267 n=1 Tax=Penaeus chinensis TaxID=139456 RepID=UPI001FB7E1F2|nr:uncharacterized protein LOC125040267 [Penaeus chinensis]
MAASIGLRGGGALSAAALLLFCAAVWSPQGAVAVDYRTCYNFTWAGDDNRTSCEERDPPCILPLVFTVPSTRPPDMEALEEYCKENQCAIKCKKEASCIRWNWYDVNDRLTNFSLFCGTVADDTNEESTGAKGVTNGCWKQRVGINMKEMCVCSDRNLCNHAHGLSSPAHSLVLFSVGIGVVQFFMGGLWVR